MVFEVLFIIISVCHTILQMHVATVLRSDEKHLVRDFVIIFSLIGCK